MIRVFGQITDASGKGVAGAMIELRALKSSTEVLYGSVLTYKCDVSGHYEFPLAIGAYDAYAQNDICGDMDYIGTAVVTADTNDGDLHHILVDGGINITPPMLDAAMEFALRAEIAATSAERDRIQTGKDVIVTGQNKQVAETKAQESATSADEAKAARDSIVQDANEVRLNTQQVADNAASVDSNTVLVQRKAEQVAQNTQTVSTKAQQVSENTQSVAANTQAVTQMRDEVVAKTSMAQGAADTATQKAASAAEHDASSAANAKIAQDAASAVQGVLIDGGECDLSSGVYPPPQTVAGKNYSTVWFVKTGGTVSGVAYDAGDVLRYTTAKGGYYFRVDAVDTTTTQINAHAAKDGAHQIGGVAGLAEALADKANAQEVISVSASRAQTITSSGASGLVLDTTSSSSDSGQFNIRKMGKSRWNTWCDNAAESGNNTGSNYRFRAYDDNGVPLGDVFSVTRATRVLDFKVTPTVNGGSVYSESNKPTAKDLGISDFRTGEERDFATRKQLAKRSDEYHPMDGQLVPRATDQGLLAAIIAGEVPSCSESDWLANPENRGCYTLGDGSTTIRIADLNGKSPGSLGAPVIRGDGFNAAAAGQIQNYAIIDHDHYITVTGDVAISRSVIGGPAGNATMTLVNVPAGSVSALTSKIRSGSVPMASEVRVVNTAKVRAVKR